MTGPDGEGRGVGTGAPDSLAGGSSAFYAESGTGKTKPLPPALHPNPARRGQPLPAPDDLDALHTDLLVDWVERLYGVAPGARMSRELLLRAVAHGLQLHMQGRNGVAAARAMAGANGRLSKNKRAYRRDESGSDRHCDNESRNASTDAFGKNGSKNCRFQPKHNGRSGNGHYSSVSPTRQVRSLPPGSRLVREWHGAIHEVIVQSDGSYLWQGRAWKSLSVIARTITGVHWSGPRFFGTAARKAGSHSTGDGEAFQSVKHPGGGNDA